LAALRLRGEANDSLRNHLGIIFAQQDSLRSAEDQFKKVLANNPNEPRALVNLANVYCVSGRFQEAEEYYLQAQSPMASQPGFYLNLALLYQMWKTEHADSAALQQKSEMYLLEAFKLLDGGEEAALNLLGILADDADLGEKADLTAWVKKQAAGLKKFIRDSGQKYLFNKTVKGTRLERKAVKRGPDKDRSYILWWA
jgi:tetratricopeptide (TPR) repeat protein